MPIEIFKKIVNDADKIYYQNNNIDLNIFKDF